MTSHNLFAFSGHMGAGKDSVAPLVMTGLSERHAINAPIIHGSFATPLRAEIDDIIQLILIMGVEGVSRTLSETFDIHGSSLTTALDVVSALAPDVINGSVSSSRDRTDSTRFALQTWGTEVRRAADPDYWVRKAMAEWEHPGTHYYTDARFPNELDAVHDSGGIVIRLLVSPEEQERRILSRDGIHVTPAMRAHPSETALDDYHDFDVIIDTDGKSLDEVSDAIINGIMTRR